MPDSYPYIISNNKLDPIFARVRSAAKPDKFGREILNNWGFTASNDRAVVGILKGLGFLTENGAPTPLYDRLRDPNDWKFVLGERVRDLYSELFSIDANMHSAPETEVKGAMLRITGKDEESVGRYYSTFKTLAALARFDGKPTRGQATPAPPAAVDAPQPKDPQRSDDYDPRRRTEYHYNIQIHLPVTTDITVYNAIFKSLKEHLNV